jgi:hypothetical protein
LREPPQRPTEVGPCPSDPLVGDLQAWRALSRGSMDPGPPAIRAAVAPSRPVVPGVVPGLFDLHAAGGGGDGGDEETRTPDPLLAKEVLYQLSYVPAAPGG